MLYNQHLQNVLITLTNNWIITAKSFWKEAARINKKRKHSDKFYYIKYLKE